MIWLNKNFWMLKKICWRPLNKPESNEIYKWCSRLSMGLEKKIPNGKSSCKEGYKMEWQMMNSLRKSQATLGFLNSSNKLELSFQEMKKSIILWTGSKPNFEMGTTLTACKFNAITKSWRTLWCAEYLYILTTNPRSTDSLPNSKECLEHLFKRRRGQKLLELFGNISNQIVFKSQMRPNMANQVRTSTSTEDRCKEANRILAPNRAGNSSMRIPLT